MATHDAAESAACVVAWNILHGGGGQRMPQITLGLLEHEPDIVVLTEFRTTTGGQIAGILSDIGLKHQLTSLPAAGSNGICIASRWPLEQRAETCGLDPQKWLACRVVGPEWLLGGVHLPDATQPTARTSYWRDLVQIAAAWSKVKPTSKALLIGDFNSGRHRLDESGRTFATTSRLGELATLGYCDIYRALHPDGRAVSWVSRVGKGFRLDSAWASPSLHADVRSVEYSQIERENRVSDHAILKIRVKIDGFSCGREAADASRRNP
ncbi:MAG: hypothetical protein SFY96_00730 [Planctomycetota bacterium]|nr:hypothetical protein [Planctomycetota bacterium]